MLKKKVRCQDFEERERLLHIAVTQAMAYEKDFYKLLEKQMSPYRRSEEHIRLMLRRSKQYQIISDLLFMVEETEDHGGNHP